MTHHIFARKHTPGTGKHLLLSLIVRVLTPFIYSPSSSCFPDPLDTPYSIGSTPSRHHAKRQTEADTLKIRAGLFCVFPYLDVRSLLRVAEVCRDWRFVARHPAVWTHLRLENARVSTEVHHRPFKTIYYGSMATLI